MDEEFDTSVDTSDADTSAAVDTPDAVEDVPVDVSGDIPEDVPAAAPEASEETDLVEDIPEDVPTAAPEASEETDLVEDIPEDVSTAAPEASEETDLVGDIPEDVSTAVPEAQDTVEDAACDAVRETEEHADGKEETLDVYKEYNGNFFNEHKLDRNYDIQSSKDAVDINNEEDVSLKRYSGDGYREINESLYNPEYEPSSEWKRQQVESDVKNITGCIDRKEIPYDSKIYRGINDMSTIFGDDFKNLSIDELNQKYAGSYFENKGFTSASTSERVAERFASSWNGGLLSIEVPEGAKGMCIGDVSLYKNGEKEILLQRGTIYRINSVGLRNNQIHVDTTAIGC